LMIAQTKGAALTILIVSLSSSIFLLAHYLAMDHVLEGVDLNIEACKYVPLEIPEPSANMLPSCVSRNVSHSRANRCKPGRGIL
jgi:hypothetical protein